MSSPCQNQGYILDGYPKTYDQAQSLFGGKFQKIKIKILRFTIFYFKFLVKKVIIYKTSKFLFNF